MTTVLFLTRRLEYGGAERQLIFLAKGLRQAGLSVRVATFYPGGPLRKDLEAAGVPIVSLRKRRRWHVLGFVRGVKRVVKEVRPDILHGYLSTANILAVFLKLFMPGMRIVWGVRASNVELAQYGWLHQVQFLIECRLSRFADLVIANSQAGRDYAVAHGFPPEKMVVINNGIDVERFRPDLEARNRLRKEWGIAEAEKLIGLVGRLDPMKGHQTFLEAAALLGRDREDIRFICVGGGPLQQSGLQEFCGRLGMNKRLIWIDSSDDMVGIYNAMDIVTSSSSFGEGFSNVIGEAMACGVSCVVSNVGDSALIVGNTGEVVKPNNPNELAVGWTNMLKRLRREPALGVQARGRIVEHFRLEFLVEKTEAALMHLQHGIPSRSLS